MDLAGMMAGCARVFCTKEQPTQLARIAEVAGLAASVGPCRKRVIAAGIG